MDVTLPILVTVGSLALFALILFLCFRFGFAVMGKKAKQIRLQKEAPLPPGTSLSTENAYILDVRYTSMMMNNMPVMALKLVFFPPDAPMRAVAVSRAFTYAELPLLIAGTMVRIAYRRLPETLSPTGEPLDLKVLGAATVEWEGDAAVKAAATALEARMKGSRLFDAEGTVLRAEQTNAILNGFPVYRYRIRFETQDGKRIEGETFQPARPWLCAQRGTGSAIKVKYSATDYNNFRLTEEWESLQEKQ